MSTPLDELLGESGNAALITIRCMRKTLHTLPVQMAAFAHGATLHYRLRDTARLAERCGVSSMQLDRMSARILVHLDEHGLQSERHLEAALAFSDGQVPSVRLALKMLWEQGEVSYRNCAPSWHRDQRRFGLRAVTHPGFDTTIDRAVAASSLVESYFRIYGPATLKDMAWWSGLGQGNISDVLSKLDVVELSLPWAGSPFFMLRESYEEFLAMPHHALRTGFHFLAHEDVALKAYFESRGRYLDRAKPSAVFNQIGEVRPSIIHDGRVVGLWSWHHASRRVHYKTFPGKVARADRHALSGQSRTLERRLRLGYVTYG